MSSINSKTWRLHGNRKWIKGSVVWKYIRRAWQVYGHASNGFNDGLNWYIKKYKLQWENK